MDAAARASVLWWSTLSGALLGLFIDATLIGVVLILSSMLPSVARPQHRWLVAAAATVLGAVPVCLGVLGYLEGRLKTV